MSEVPTMAAGERGGNNLNGFEDFRTENGSSQGQNLALTGLFVPSSIDSGHTLLSYGEVRPFDQMSTCLT